MNQFAKNTYERWMVKASSYKEKDLNSYFDKYFSLFVAYNILYNQISEKLFIQKKIKKDRYGRFSDKASATKYITLFIDKSILKDTLCVNSITEIFNLIPAYFNITNNDNKLKSNWETKNDVQSILEILYGIRCNMFHGSKDFKDDQIKLLIPAIKLLEELNKTLYNKLT